MSASSIIQFYLNTAITTANSSQHEINNTTTTIPSTPASFLKKSTPVNPIIYQKIEHLPTPAAESNIEIVSSTSEAQQQAAKTGSGVPSFFSIPLKFFNSYKKSTAKDDGYEDEVDKEIADFKSASPIDVITDSPTEILSSEHNDHYGNSGSDNAISVEKINAELLKSEITYKDNAAGQQSELISSDYDPIYDTYISYLNHTTPEGELILDDISTQIINHSNPPAEKLDSQQPIVNQDLHLEKQSYNQPVYDHSNYEDIQLVFGTSTLKRIKTKTKELFRQLSNHYSAGEYHHSQENLTPDSLKEVTQPSSFRNGLKRRLSSVSTRRNNLGPKWKWSKKVNEPIQLDTISASQHSPYKTSTFGHRSDSQGKNRKITLSEFFESPDFESRLSRGSVSGRKSYQEDENVKDIDGYHVSYREADQQLIDGIQELQKPIERAVKEEEIEHFYWQFASFQERFRYFKDKTIKRTKSFQKYAKYFTQEV